MSSEARVSRLPDCDFCRELGETTPATYDFKTKAGFWANGCEKHFAVWNVGLGTGRGQKLVVG